MPAREHPHPKPASALRRLARGRGSKAHPYRAVARIALFALFILGPVLGLAFLFFRTP